MKRICLLLSVILLAFSLAACSASSPSPFPTPQPIDQTPMSLESTAIPPTQPIASKPSVHTSEPPALPSLGDTWRSPADGMLLAYIPAGEFLMGSSKGQGDVEPEHTVYLDAFWMDMTEVTNAMFERFVQQTTYQTTAEKEGWSMLNDPEDFMGIRTKGADWRHPFGPKSDLAGMQDHPVVHVSWHDARAYCE